MAKAEVAQIKGSNTLPRSAVKPAEFARALHCVTVPYDTPVESLLEPEYWSQVAVKFRNGDRVEATEMSGKWLAEFYVIAATKVSVHLRQMTYYEFDEAEIAEPAEMCRVEWKGGKARWRVVRNSDGEVLADQIEDKLQAQAKAAEFNKAA